MCVICDGGDLTGLKRLVCCERVAEVPVIAGLETLVISEGSPVRSIPPIESLVAITCEFTVVVELPDPSVCRALKILVCNETDILSIPPYPALEVLYCVGCDEVRALPELPNLRALYCGGARLKTVPSYPCLTRLECGRGCMESFPEQPAAKLVIIEHCRLLRFVPRFPSLENLRVRYCQYLLSIMQQHRFSIFDIAKCPLVYIPRTHRNSLQKCNAGSRVRGWACRARRRLAARAEVARVLWATGHAAFVAGVVGIVARLI